MPGPGSVACPKPTRQDRERRERREDRSYQGYVREIHDYVFARERSVCRICRCRPAESMDELRPRSLGGKVSKRNSHAVCGDGVRGCHGLKTRNEITWRQTELGTEGPLWLTANTAAAAEHMKIQIGQEIESLPMQAYETE